MARWLALLAITQQISCAGGGGGGSTSSNFNPAPVASVSISPPSTQLSAGASIQFTAIIKNASNPAVTWEVNGIPGGNSSVGTITPSGAATASYTAPASVSSVLVVTVAAVLQADGTKSGSATVTINPSPTASITIAPANTTVVAGDSLQFNASVQNGPQAVIWEVNGVAGGSANFGTITSPSTGSPVAVYTAPAAGPIPFVVTITARLFSDTSVSGSTNLTIVPPTPTLSISPTTANVPTGQTVQFTADVQNSSAPLNWQLSGPAGADLGSIVAVGSGATFTAPSVIPATPSPFTVTVTAVLQTSPPLSASAGVTIVSSGSFAGVYSWRNDNSLTGQNSQETKLLPSTVSPTTFGKLFGCTVDGAIFAQPLYAANVTTPTQGTHNVVYVATENDTVYAFDADSSACQILWKVSFTDLTSGITAVPAADISGQTDIAKVIGITGTPVIDPATATLYVVAKTKAIQNGSPVYTQKLHALDLTTGAEKFNGPAIIQATVNGIGDGTVNGRISFNSLTENQRSALLLASGNVYVAFDSYSDTDPFHGWLFAYNAGNLQAVPAVFNTTPNGSRGGIGESGAAPSSDASGNIFVVTSDGKTAVPNIGTDYPDTALKLQINTASSSLNPIDSFMRPNETLLEFEQKYFGSNGVLLLPDSAGSTVHPHLALAGDEAANLYLLDREKLATDGALQTLCVGASLRGTPAYWVSNNVPTIYVAAAYDSLKVFPLANGAFSSVSCPSQASATSQSAEQFSTFGASPVISSNGSGSGIVWALDTSGYVTGAPAILRAYDATNLANKLYASPASASDPQAAGLAVKFAVPTVANGKVYVATQGELSVFGLQ